MVLPLLPLLLLLLTAPQHGSPLPQYYHPMVQGRDYMYSGPWTASVQQVAGSLVSLVAQVPRSAVSYWNPTGFKLGAWPASPSSNFRPSTRGTGR